MYTLLVLIVTAVSRVICQNPCANGLDVKCKNAYDHLFNLFTKDLKEVEGNLKEACLKYSNISLREVLEPGRFILTAQLRGYSVDDFDIKINSSVLYVSVSHGRAYSAELVILPRFVNVMKAYYSYNVDTLDIVFPINAKTGVCEGGFSKGIVIVPKFELRNKHPMRSKQRSRYTIYNDIDRYSTRNQASKLTFEKCQKDVICMKRWDDQLQFEALASIQSRVERNFKTACLKYSTAHVQEVVRTGSYELITKLSGYSEDDFGIKIKENALYLSARNARVFNKELAILPRFVNVKNAKYNYTDDTLHIYFPISTVTAACDRGFRDAFTTVPKSDTTIVLKSHTTLRVTSEGTTPNFGEVFSCEKGSSGLDFNCIKRWHDRFFEVFATNQLWLHDQLSDACHKYSNVHLREVIETGRYKLTALMSGYSKSNFDIKIRGNILYVSARNGRRYNAELAILPRFVDTTKVSYYYEENMLNIVFPIKTVTGACDHGFRHDVMRVPNFQTVWRLDRRS